MVIRVGPTAGVDERWCGMRPRRRPLATALLHDLIVVTRNVSDYDRTGVRLLNPFETAL